MAETCRQVLKDMGVDPGRLALEWASAAEAPRFVELITGFVNGIRSKGALGQGRDEVGEDRLGRRLEASIRAAGARKVRTALGTLAKRMRKQGDYDPGTIAKGVEEKVLPAFRAERIGHEVLACLSDRGACSMEELLAATGASPEELDKITAPMVKKGTLKQDGEGLALAAQGEAR